MPQPKRAGKPRAGALTPATPRLGFHSNFRAMDACVQFLILTQCGHRPPRYGRSERFDTKPSKPNSQAFRKRSGPISPCSKSETKMPLRPEREGRQAGHGQSGRLRRLSGRKRLFSVLRYSRPSCFLTVTLTVLPCSVTS